MLQYYTLDQAAKILGVNQDRAKKLLDEHKVRQYRDGRGGVRYVASAVDELARALGRGSDPELPLGEAPKAKSGNSPRPSKLAKAEAEDESTFDFDLPLEDSAEVAIGREKLGSGAGSSKKGAGSSGKGGPKSPSPKSPPPKPGSDSDVRLVTDGSDLEFQLNADSDVKMVDEAESSSHSGASAAARSAPPPAAEGPGDSGVRIVPMDLPSDSDVRINEEEGSVVLDRPPGKKHSDSDIRLEEVARPAPRPDEKSDDALVTEEIDLDAEERKHAEKAKSKGGRSKMKRVDSPPPLPTSSPFELSEDDLDHPEVEKKKKPDSSSDFELTPGGTDSSDEALALSSSELAAMPPKAADDSSDEVSLGELSASGASASGINLDAPMDSGISLEGSEGSGDEMEFELSLDSGSTPKPGPKSGKAKVPEPEDSDSEFELTLDTDSSSEQPVLQQAPDESAEADSDSEFELTLDDSGGLVPLESSGEQPAAAAAEKGEEGDIFETDFEVPALDEESGSEAVALDESDTDLESSDFDLALEEGDAASDEESGSQVVALEEGEEADEGAETVQRPRKKAKAPPKKAAEELEEDVGELLEGEEEGEALEELAGVEDEEAVAGEEEEGEAEPQRRAAPVAAAAAAPAPWGPVPALVLMPCLIVMLLAGMMGYELINNMLGYQQPGKVTGFLSESLAKTFDLDLPKD
jgi:hypothetical protein